MDGLSRRRELEKQCGDITKEEEHRKGLYALKPGRYSHTNSATYVS